ncbi:MAG: DUF4959 domain-containing protein, partial [Prevotellaceae bacterium]|nr:DUF4959 domain-containing protein [Prevotellaceae bacterium]
EAISAPGGAIITYRVPGDRDILQVKAVYRLTTGQQYEVSASFYENSLTVTGFNDTLEHEALLYAINRAQELSDPVPVRFTPEESSLSKTAKTVNIISCFGGANFSWINEDEAPLVFELLSQNSQGELQTTRILQSEVDSASVNLRGYASVPQKFALVITDNWGNTSGSIYPDGGTVTPIQENKLDKSIMTFLKLENDQPWNLWGAKEEYMIDDDVSTFGHTDYNALPAPFTMDLGKPAKLSRILLFQWLFDNKYYGHGNPRRFEVYGRTEKPSPNSNWNEWTKIMDCELIKPSGLTGNSVTNEDLIYAEKGHEFDFPLDLEPVRYLRFNVLGNNWEGQSYTHITELTFYGIYVEE